MQSTAAIHVFFYFYSVWRFRVPLHLGMPQTLEVGYRALSVNGANQSSTMKHLRSNCRHTLSQPTLNDLIFNF